MNTIQCVLKKTREKPVEGHHPWIFSGSIDEIEEGFKAGDLVRVYAYDKRFLGVGYLNPRSQIAIRMLTFRDEVIDAAFFERRIKEAILIRERFLPPKTTAYRLIHSEGDFLPGLIVDRYGDFLVAQFLTAGIDAWKECIVKILEKSMPAKGIFEREEAYVSEWEGLEPKVQVLSGAEPPDYVQITENGLDFVVDIRQGQKTGFFLDQRQSRKRVQEISKGKRVLNSFAYTGAFSVYALAGGAEEVVTLDSSEPALNTAKVNFQKNGFDPNLHTFIKEDVFTYLRDTRQEFDLIILDPPALCAKKQDVLQAARAYKDVNLYGIKRLAKSGLLLTCSCSSYVTPDLFQKILFAAAKDAKRNLRILDKTAHDFDHPINVYHPEGEYLKSFLCHVE